MKDVYVNIYLQSERVDFILTSGQQLELFQHDSIKTPNHPELMSHSCSLLFAFIVTVLRRLFCFLCLFTLEMFSLLKKK